MARHLRLGGELLANVHNKDMGKEHETVEFLKSKLKLWLPSILAVVLTCLYPCVFIYSQNAGEARAVDMLLFLGIFLGTAVVILGVMGLVFRNMSRAAFITCLAMLVVINFSLVANAVESVMPWFYAKYQLVVMALLGLGLMVLLYIKKPNMRAGCIILALTFGAMTLVSIFTAIPKLISAASYVREAQAEQEETVVDETIRGDKPNVYYLLFDEYGGDENLQYYFDYDNSDFYQELESRGFSVSHSSYNTESCWTDTLVPNLLNMDYVASDEMPEKARREYLENPYMAELLRENGYSVNVINHRAYLRVEDANELTEGQTEDTISEYLLENSIFNKIDFFYNRINYLLFADYRDNYADPLNNCFAALKNCWQETDGPTLTISYIQSPHAPFVFNSDGSVRDLTTGWYWKDDTLYPGQLQYVNTLILEAVDNIQKNDPTAVILLMSDHGARVPLHMVEQYGGPRFDAETQTHIMQSVLCAVRVPGQDLDIEGQNGINTTRMVFNSVFQMELEMIPEAEGYVLPEYYNARKDWRSDEWMPDFVEKFAVEEEPEKGREGIPAPDMHPDSTGGAYPEPGPGPAGEPEKP